MNTTRPRRLVVFNDSLSNGMSAWTTRTYPKKLTFSTALAIIRAIVENFDQQTHIHLALEHVHGKVLRRPIKADPSAVYYTDEGLL